MNRHRWRMRPYGLVGHRGVCVCQLCQNEPKTSRAQQKRADAEVIAEFDGVDLFEDGYDFGPDFEWFRWAFELDAQESSWWFNWLEARDSSPGWRPTMRYPVEHAKLGVL